MIALWCAFGVLAVLIVRLAYVMQGKFEAVAKRVEHVASAAERVDSTIETTYTREIQRLDARIDSKANRRRTRKEVEEAANAK